MAKVTLDEQRRQAIENGSEYDKREMEYILQGGRVDFEDGLVAGRQAWHGQARVFDEGNENGIPWDVAINDPAINFPVLLTDVYADVEGFGKMKVEDKFATVRGDTGAPLGIVGKRYRPIQVEQGFQWLKQLVDADELLLESVISLRGGRTVAIEARRPESILIAGETVMPFLGFMNSHDGTGQALMLATDERMVCRNTCKFALKNAKAVYKIRHTASADIKLAEARNLLEISWEYTEALKALGDELAMKPVSDKAFDDFLESLVYVPEPEYGTTEDGQLRIVNQSTITKRTNTREAVRENYMKSDNLNNIRGTEWGVLMAVTEWEQHINTYKNADRRAEVILQGGNLGQRALDIMSA